MMSNLYRSVFYKNGSILGSTGLKKVLKGFLNMSLHILDGKLKFQRKKIPNLSSPLKSIKYLHLFLFSIETVSLSSKQLKNLFYTSVKSNCPVQLELIEMGLFLSNII